MILCFIDCETDGLHHLCRPWEIAIVRRDEAGQTEHHWFLPLDLRHADQQALKIGGFWDRHPVGRKVSGKPAIPCEPVPSAHDVAKEIMRLTFGATLVGSGVHYDADVLARLLRAEGYLPSWSHRLRCVATLASGMYGRDLGGLDAVMTEIGLAIPESQRHTAMGDAWAAAGVWDHVMYGSRP